MYRRIHILLFLCACCFLAISFHAFASHHSVHAADAWYNSSWLYRNKITFDNTAQATTFTNFPVVVKLNAGNFDFTKAQANGNDVRFVTSDNTVLPYEIESWDSGSQTANLWVKVPSLLASTGTGYIYLYFGNATAPAGQNKNLVWDSNFKMVQHFGESSAVPAAHNIGFVPISIVGDANYLYVASQNDGGVKIINKNDFSVVKNLHTGAPITSIERVYVSGNYLAMAGTNSHGYIYNLATSTEIADITYANHLRSTYIDATRVYFGEQDSGTVDYINLSDLSQGSFTPATDDIRDINGDGTYLFIASNDSHGYLVDETTLATITTFSDIATDLHEEVTGIDSTYLWSASDFRKVIIRNRANPYTIVATLYGPTSDINEVQRDGNYWFVACDDGKVYVYLAPNFELVNIISSGGTSQTEQLWVDTANSKLYFVRGNNDTGVSEQNVYVMSYPSDIASYEKRVDSTGNAVSLTGTEQASNVTGIVGQAVNFDGTNSYISQKKFFTASDGFAGGFWSDFLPVSQLTGGAFFYAPNTNLSSFLGDGVTNNYFLRYYYYKNPTTYVESGYAGTSGSGLVSTAKITNAGFESGFTNGVGTGWTKDRVDHTFSDETVIKHSDGHAQKITALSTANHMGIDQNVTIGTGGNLIYYGAWVYTSKATNVNFYVGGTFNKFSTAATTWTYISGYANSSATDAIRIYINKTDLTIGDYIVIDDVFVNAISDIPANQGFKLFSTKNGNTNTLTLRDTNLNSNYISAYDLYQSALQLQGNITLEAWVYPNSDTGDQFIAGNGGDSSGYLLYRSGKKFYAKVNGTLISTGATDKASGSWYDVVLTLDGTNAKIYVNGSLYATDANSLTLPAVADRFAIGGSSSGIVAQTNMFNGKIDEVRVSDTARSADWIKAQYANMNGNFVTISSRENAVPPSMVSTNSGNGGTNANCPSGFVYCISSGPHLVGSASFITGDDANLGVQAFVGNWAHHDDVHVTITKESPMTMSGKNIPFPWAQGFNTVSDVYNFTAVSAFNGYPIPEFDKPATVLLPYDPAKLNGRSPNQLRIAWYDTKAKKWAVLQNNSVVNLQTHIIANTTKNFSYFAVVYPVLSSVLGTNTSHASLNIAPDSPKVSPTAPPIKHKTPSNSAKSSTHCVLFICW